MGAIDLARAKNVLDAIHGVAAFVAPTGSMHTRLMTANGSESANGTELATSAGYTAGTGAPTHTWAAATGTTSASAATNSAVTVTNMPAATIVGIEEWDSAATPLRFEWGALSANKTTNLGDTFSIPSGSMTDSL